ncbi:MAG: histidine kinase dimerization/phospho-acceptor domain-containing protein, partial [Chloroflexota bacterium]
MTAVEARREGLADDPRLEALDRLPVGVLVVDRSGQITYRNARLDSIWAVAPGDDPDLDRYATCLGPDGRPLDRTAWPIWQALQEGTSTSDRAVEISRTDGDIAIVAVNCEPTLDSNGTVTGAILTATDITRRQEDARLRDAFVAIVSHELRTPVTSVLGGVSLLLQQELPPETAREVMLDVAAEAERIHRLIDDLLTAARVEGGVTEFAADPILLQRVIPRVADEEATHWRDLRFHLDLDGDLPAVAGDEGAVTQVLRNLISNAAKYGPSDGLVRVSAERGDGEVVVRVIDEGPGIADA